MFSDFRMIYKIDFYLIKKFERFKERVKSELEIAIYNVLFK